MYSCLLGLAKCSIYIYHINDGELNKTLLIQWIKQQWQLQHRRQQKQLILQQSMMQVKHARLFKSTDNNLLLLSQLVHSSICFF